MHRVTPSQGWGYRSWLRIALVGALLPAAVFGTAFSPAVAEGQVTADNQARALELFTESATAYREGRLAEAARLLEEAYALHPEPVLLYNLARVLDAEGDVEGALDAYQRFLSSDPDTTRGPLARRRIEVIEGQLREREEREAAERAALEASRTPDVDPNAHPAHAPDLIGPGLTLGSGLVVAAVGAILIGVGVLRYDAAAIEPIHLDAANLEREAFTLRDAGIVVAIVGGAVAAVGAIWIAVASTSSSSETSAGLEFRLGPTGAVLCGRF